jgi:hypothetical protein
MSSRTICGMTPRGLRAARAELDRVWQWFESIDPQLVARRDARPVARQPLVSAGLELGVGYLEIADHVACLAFLVALAGVSVHRLVARVGGWAHVAGQTRSPRRVSRSI